MSEQDRIFMKNFALVIAGLMGFTIIVVIVAMKLNEKAGRPDNPDRGNAVDARIAPVGEVYAGDTGRAAMQEAMASQTSAAAFGGSMDGSMIYQQVCAACHTTGVAGSPKLTQTAWEPRLEKGMDTLVDHAVNGFQGDTGVMPAKGGRMDLSDEQVRATVEWMLDNLE